MNYGNKRVLVTGATGLIGRELVLPLEQSGFDVYAITIDENNPDNGVHWLKGNLFDESFVKKCMEDVKPEYLLNMAWATTGDYLKANINYSFLSAGINLIQAFAKNGGKRAVYAGTCFEYKFKEAPLKETDPLDPNKTIYTFCKDHLHQLAERFCKDNGISFGYGRIFYVYGRNEDKTRLTGMIIDKLSKDEEVLIKSGSLKKDYIYTKDIAGAFSALLDSQVEGTVNICTGKAISIHDYALTIAQKLSKKILVQFKDEPSNQPPIIVGDNSRLTKEVGYQLQYDLESALEEILK